MRHVIAVLVLVGGLLGFGLVHLVELRVLPPPVTGAVWDEHVTSRLSAGPLWCGQGQGYAPSTRSRCPKPVPSSAIERGWHATAPDSRSVDGLPSPARGG
ncbi:MAG: hypothetical protein ABIJ09_15985 [Pseudomonadota bacterium]